MPRTATLAENLAAKQREISVAEFFERNRQILGFDNPVRSLLTTVKEGVDNSVEWSEPVLIRRGGEVQLVPIGEFVDACLGEALAGEPGTAPIEGVEVLAFEDSDCKIGWRPASKVHRHSLKDQLFEIDLVSGRKVTVTGSHSVFALRQGRIVPSAVRDLAEGEYVVVPRKAFVLGGTQKQLDLRNLLTSHPRSLRERLMVRGVAKDLDVPRDWKRFDYVPYTYFEDHGIPIPDHASISVRNGRSSLPVLIELTPEFLRVLGYFASEGTAYEGWVTFSFGSHEEALLADTEHCLSTIRAKMRFPRVQAHATAVTIKVHSKIFSVLLRDLLGAGHGAGSKKVPWVVWNVSTHLQEHFLHAYIAGDGHVSDGKTTTTTISQDLSTGLQYLYSSFGIPFSVLTTKESTRTFPGGRTSRCQPAHFLYVYDGPGHARSPLSRVPLAESGLRKVVHGGLHLLPYTDTHRYTVDLHSSFVIEGALATLAKIGVDPDPGLREEVDRVRPLLQGDLGFLQVRAVRRVATAHPFVYDFSVPGSEKFLGGRGPIFLHNSLDAAEEASVLPDIKVEISKEGTDRLRVAVEDNGPGILSKQIPNVFGRLLYGSRFHANRQSRGQQGIGISAAVLYAGLTTARPARIISKVGEEEAAHVVELLIDTQKNLPRVVSEDLLIWDREHGTRIELVLKAKYMRGRQSPFDYLKNTAIVNPHARISLVEPDGTRVTWERAATEVPPVPKEVQPHPYGLELGELAYHLKGSKRLRLDEALQKEFAGVTPRASREILEKCQLTSKQAPDTVTGEGLERLLAAMHETPLVAPSLESLSPIGPLLIKRGLKNVLGDIRPEFVAPPVSRPPKIRGGFPFVVEVGLVFGGGLPSDQQIQLLRFANRVPLLFQQGACAITNAVSVMDWRRYGLDQKGGSGLPIGPVLLLVHIASTKIPFTSEAKEAVAEDPEIDKEITLAVQAAARHLKTHLSRRTRQDQAAEKFLVIQRILPRLAEKTSKLVGKPVPDLTAVITKIMDIVYVESAEPETDKVERRTTVHVTVTNYTPRPRVLELFVEMPKELFGPPKTEPAPEGTDAELGRAWWTLPKLLPNTRTTVHLTFPGISIDADDLDWYVAGVDEAHLIGAESLPGDWDVRLPRAVIEAATAEGAPLPLGEDGEVDLDGAEAQAGLDDE